MNDRALIKKLKSTPFFYELSSEEFSELAQKIKTCQLKIGTTVIREKEGGGALFFVAAGVLKVTIKNPKNGKTILLSKLRVGNFFGEYSLLTGRQRTATVSAITDAKVIEIPRVLYQKIAMKYPGIRRFFVDICLQNQRHNAQLMLSLGVDRKKESRFTLKGKIQFRECVPEGKKQVTTQRSGTLVDLSRDGIGFRVSADEINKGNPDMYGKECNVTIEADGFPGPINVLGKVVNFEVGIAKRELTDYYAVGMKFIEIGKADKKAFKKLLHYYSHINGVVFL